jgi:hypothetical protein
VGCSEAPDKLMVWLQYWTGGFAGRADDPIPTARSLSLTGSRIPDEFAVVRVGRDLLAWKPIHIN